MGKLLVHTAVNYQVHVSEYGVHWNFFFTLIAVALFAVALEGGVGFVPAENLEGKADLILFSWRQGASLFKPWTWFLNARWDRFLHPLR